MNVPPDDGSSHWRGNPALAKLAFGDGTTLPPGVPSPTETASAERDLSDPAQREFGDYELLERIDQGGMGVVYRARQSELDREVAIKLLSAGVWASSDFVVRFRHEAQNAARLQHPGIVSIFEMGEFDGLLYYAMQLVRGDNLAKWLQAPDALPTPRDAALLTRHVAESVAYAHSLGVLHLDLKPGNILIDEDGHPVVADFGLARRIGSGIPALAGLVAGTPGYMAPEQSLPDQPLTEATDVWGIGTILRSLLPAKVPPDLRAICAKCLAPSPADRYADARALADDLGRFLEGRPVVARRLNWMQRIGHWCKREPRMAAVVTMSFLLVLCGLVFSVLMWLHAERSGEQAREVNRFLNDDLLAAASPEFDHGNDGANVTMPMLLKNAERKLDLGLVREPAVRAQTELTIGESYFGLGLWPQAVSRLARARVDAVSALGSSAPLTLEIEERLGQAMTYNGDLDAAGAIFRHLLEEDRRRYGRDAPETIRARRGYAAYLYESDRFQEAASEYESLHGAAVAHAPEQLNDIDWELSDLYAELNRWDDAEQLLRNALKRSRDRLGPDNVNYLWQTQSLVDLLNMRAKWDEAESLAKDAHEKLTAAVGADHPRTLSAIHYLGQIELARGRPQQALPLLQQALAGRIRVHGESHKWTQYTMNRVGEALLALHRPKESAAILEHALDLATRAGRRKQPYVLLILDNLALARMALGEPAKATKLVDEALGNSKANLPANNIRRAMVEQTAGDVMARLGRVGEAKQHYRNALAIYTPGFGPQHPLAIELRRKLAAP